MDIRKKIDIHGAKLKKSTIAEYGGMLLMAFFVSYFVAINISYWIFLALVFYICILLFQMWKQMIRDKKYYKYGENHPAYKYLSKFGSPDEIIDKIEGQIERDDVIYKSIAKPNKAEPETVITTEYFVHMATRAFIIPLDKIICFYMYDNVTKISPKENFLPTYFKPIHFMVTYGEGSELAIRYTDIDYKEVLKVLDSRLPKKVIYTRELGTLYKTDYKEFLKAVKKAIKQAH